MCIFVQKCNFVDTSILPALMRFALFPGVLKILPSLSDNVYNPDVKICKITYFITEW